MMYSDETIVKKEEVAEIIAQLHSNELVHTESLLQLNPFPWKLNDRRGGGRSRLRKGKETFTVI